MGSRLMVLCFFQDGAPLERQDDRLNPVLKMTGKHPQDKSDLCFAAGLCGLDRTTGEHQTLRPPK